MEADSVAAEITVDGDEEMRREIHDGDCEVHDPSLLANEPLITETNHRPVKEILRPTCSDASARSVTPNSAQKNAKVNWNDPRVKAILQDYKEKGIGSTRIVATRIARLTGVLVSHSTISRQCRSKNKSSNRTFPKADGSYLENDGQGPSAGVSGYQRADQYDDFDDEEQVEIAAFMRAQRSAEKAGSLRYNRKGVAKNKIVTPYYLSFSERFKQTSLTVHLSADEVRIYRHTSHSRSGRAIYFRCSRCDGINRKLRTGLTPRIKMFDGVVIGDMYPEHHPRCKPMNIIEARLKEIDRRCRKDIIDGMDPRAAWEKGRKMAEEESYSINSPLYECAPLVNSYPDWEKCKRLYSNLRQKVMRRKVENGFYDPRRISLHEERNEPLPSTSSARNNIDDLSSVDFGERPVKRPRHSNSFNSDELEEDLWEESDGHDDFRDNIYTAYEEMDDFVDDFDSPSMDYTIDVANEEEVETSKILRLDETDSFSSDQNPPSINIGRRITVAGAPPFISSRPVSRNSQHLVFSQPPNGMGTILDPGFRNDDPISYRSRRPVSSSDGTLPATVPTPKVTPEDAQCVKTEPRNSTPRRQQAHYDVTQPLQKESSNSESTSVISTTGRPKRTIRPLRKLSPMPRQGTSQLQTTQARLTTSQIKKEKNSKNSKPEAARAVEPEEVAAVQDGVPIVTPAGVVYSNGKRERNFTKHETQERLKQIEKNIAEYNAYSGNKIATILVRREGEAKLFGDSSIVNACLNTELIRHLLRGQTSTESKVVSVPLLKPRSDAEIDAIHNSKIGSLLSELISSLQYPSQQSYEGWHPEYWPSDVVYCNPSKDDVLFKNVGKNPEFRCFNSVADGQRAVLKYASKKYLDFLGKNFGESVVTDIQNNACEVEDDVENDSLFASSSEAAQQLPAAVSRYDTMPEDYRQINRLLSNIQERSSCRGLSVFADEENRLTLSGDKTLISAIMNSKLDHCIKNALLQRLDKEMATLHLVQRSEDSALERMSDSKAIDLLEDVMLHLNFPSTSFYDDEKPAYWPVDMPFCSLRLSDDCRILNLEKGIKTRGEAAKVVLRNIWRFIKQCSETCGVNGSNRATRKTSEARRNDGMIDASKKHENSGTNVPLKYSPSPAVKASIAAFIDSDSQLTSESRKQRSGGVESASRLNSERALNHENGAEQTDHSRASSVKHFLKVFCSCRERGEITSRDCHYCDRCVRYFHDKCLPLKEVDRFFLCVKCSPSGS